jgi:hypothetical protein
MNTINFLLPDGSRLPIPAGMSFEASEEYAKKIKPEAYAGKASINPLRDIPGALVGGIGGLIQFPGQVGTLMGADPNNAFVRAGEAVSQFGQEIKSEGAREREAKIQAAIKAAEDKGLAAEAKEALVQYASNPYITFTKLVEQLPNLVASYGSGLAAQVGVKTAARIASREVAEKTLERAGVAGAAGVMAPMQGADVGQETYNRAYNAAVNKGYPEAQARQLALIEAREAALKAGAVSAATMAFLPGIEKAMFRPQGTKVLKAVGRGMGGEGLQEGTEEGSGAYFAGKGEQAVDPEVDPWRGVGGRAATGAILGGLMGGAAGGVGAYGEKAAADEQARAGKREQEALEREQKRVRDEAEAAKKNTPEYLQKLDADYNTYIKQLEALKEREAELGKPAANTSEAAQKSQIRKARQEFEKTNKDLVEEHAANARKISALKFDPDAFMARLGDEKDAPKDKALPKFEGEKARVAEILQELNRGAAFTGEPPSAQTIVSAFAEDPAVLEYVAKSPDALPFVSKSLSKLIKQEADRVRKNNARNALRAEQEQNAAAAEEEARKKQEETDRREQMFAEIATQPTEPTPPGVVRTATVLGEEGPETVESRAYTKNISIIPVDREAPGTPEPFARTDTAAPRAPLPPRDRLRLITQLEQRVKQLDDEVKQAASEDLTPGSDAFMRAAWAQQQRDIAIRQLQEVKQDFAREQQNTTPPADDGLERLVEEALGSGVEDIDAAVQRTSNAKSALVSALDRSISDLTTFRAQKDTLDLKGGAAALKKTAEQREQGLAQDIEKNKLLLAMTAARQIALARESRGLMPLTMPEQRLIGLIKSRIDRVWNPEYVTKGRDEAERQKALADQLALVRAQLRVLKEPGLDYNMKRSLGARVKLTPEDFTESQLKRLQEAERNLVEQQGLSFGAKAIEREVQKLVDNLSLRGEKTRNVIDRSGREPRKVEGSFFGKQYPVQPAAELRAKIAEAQAIIDNKELPAMQRSIAGKNKVAWTKQLELAERVEAEQQAEQEAKRRERVARDMPDIYTPDLFETAAEEDLNKAKAVAATMPPLPAARAKAKTREAEQDVALAERRLKRNRGDIEAARGALLVPAVQSRIKAARTRLFAARAALNDVVKGLDRRADLYIGKLGDKSGTAKTDAEKKARKEAVAKRLTTPSYEKALDAAREEVIAAQQRLKSLEEYALPEAIAADEGTVTTDAFRKATAPLRLAKAAEDTLANAKKAEDKPAKTADEQLEEAKEKFRQVSTFSRLEDRPTPTAAEKSAAVFRGAPASYTTAANLKADATLAEQQIGRLEAAALQEKQAKRRLEETTADQEEANEKVDEALKNYNRFFEEAKKLLAFIRPRVDRKAELANQALSRLNAAAEQAKKSEPKRSGIRGEPFAVQQLRDAYEKADQEYQDAISKYREAEGIAANMIKAAQERHADAVDASLKADKALLDARERVAETANQSAGYAAAKLSIDRARALASTRADSRNEQAQQALDRYNASVEKAGAEQRKLEALYKQRRNEDLAGRFDIKPWGPATEIKPARGPAKYGTQYYIDEARRLKTENAREERLAANAESRALAGKKAKDVRGKTRSSNKPVEELAQKGVEDFEAAVRRGERETDVRPQRNAKRGGFNTGVSEASKRAMVAEGAREARRAPKLEEIEADTGEDVASGFRNEDRFFSPKESAGEVTPDKVRRSYKHPIHNKSFKQAGEWLLENTKDPVKRALLARVISTLGNAGGKVEFTTAYENAGNNVGQYDIGAKVIAITPRVIDDGQLIQDTLFHELVHAATVAGLRIDPGLRGRINSLMQRVEAWAKTPEGKKFLERSDVGGALTEDGKVYAFKNAEEFLAEAFSSPDFQRILRQVPAGSKRVWSRLAEFIGRYFGAKNETEFTAMEEAIQLGEDAMLSNWIANEVGSEQGQGVFQSVRRQTAQHESDDLANASDTMIGKPKRAFKEYLAAFSGLGFRTRVIDNWAAVAEAVKKGDYAQSVQTMYDIMNYQNRSHLVHQIVMNGAPTRSLFADKTAGKQLEKVEVEDGASLRRVQELLKEVKGYGNQEAVNEAFTLLAVGKRAQTLGWDRVFGDLPKDTEETKAKKAAARAQADRLAEQLDKGESPFKDAYDEYQEFNKNMLKFVRDSGVISEDEFRQLSKNRNYTPLFRENKTNKMLELELDSGRVITVGKLTDEAHLEKLVGGGDQITDFFSASVRNAAVLADAALHNFAMRNVAFALKSIDAAQFVGDKVKNPDIIEFRVKGETKRMVVDTEALGIPTDLVVKGMAGVPMSMPSAIRLMGVPAQWTRKLVTRNPLYMMRQLIRDPLAAWLVTGADTKPVLGTLTEVAKAATGRADKTLERRGVTGGMTFGENIGDIEDLQKRVSKDPSLLGAVALWLEDAAHGADAVTRRNVYQGALKAGLSEAEAMLATFESMPFSKRGTSTTIRMANHVVPFLSAAIQGWDVMYRAAKGDMPMEERVNVRNKLLMRGAMIGAMTMLYAAAMADDEAYKNANTEERLGNWFLPVPGMKEPIRVPIPFELGIFFKMIPEALVRTAMGKEGDEEAAAVLKAAVNMFPMAGLPQAIKPLVEVAADYSFFTGRSIEPAGSDALDISERVGKETTELAKLIGFDVNIAGKQLGVSPVQVEYLFNQYTAGLFGVFAALVDNVLPAPTAAKPDRALAELPLFKTVLQREDAGGRVNKLYDKMEQFTRASRTYKELIDRGEFDKAQEYVEKNQDKVVKGMTAEKMRASINKLNELENKIRANPDLDGTAKKEAIERIKENRKNLSNQYLEALAA